MYVCTYVAITHICTHVHTYIHTHTYTRHVCTGGLAASSSPSAIYVSFGLLPGPTRTYLHMYIHTYMHVCVGRHRYTHRRADTHTAAQIHARVPPAPRSSRRNRADSHTLPKSAPATLQQQDSRQAAQQDNRQAASQASSQAMVRGGGVQRAFQAYVRRGALRRVGHATGTIAGMRVSA